MRPARRLRTSIVYGCRTSTTAKFHRSVPVPVALSVVGTAVAAAGYLPPVAGAIFQEVIDVIAVVNALRVAIPPRTLTDY